MRCTRFVTVQKRRGSSRGPLVEQGTALMAEMLRVRWA